MGKRIIAMLLAVAMCTELLAGCRIAVSITTDGDIGAAVDASVKTEQATANGARKSTPAEKSGVASAMSHEKETKDTPGVSLQDQGSYRVSDQTERLYCVTDETGKGAVFGWLKEAADATLLSPGKSIEGAEITLLGADMQPMSEDYAGLSGVIIDKENSLPVSGAKMELYRTGDTIKVGGHRGERIGEPGWSRQESGTFSFTGLEPGNYWLYVSKEGDKRFESGFFLEEGEGNPRKVVLEPLKELKNPERVESTPSPDVTVSPQASPSPTATVTPQPTPSVTPSPSTTSSATPTVNSTVSPMVSPRV